MSFFKLFKITPAAKKALPGLDPTTDRQLKAARARSKPGTDTVFVIDRSGSMDCGDPSRMDWARRAAFALCGARQTTPGFHEACFVGYNETADRFGDWMPVADTSAIVAAMEPMRAGGGTQSRSGLIKGEEILECRDHDRRREIIQLSDGYDHSPSDATEVAKRIKSQGVVIRTVGIGRTPSAVDEELLRTIASIGPDGYPLYRFISDIESLIEHFRKIGTLLLT